MRSSARFILAAAVVTCTSSPVVAVPVSWTNWTTTAHPNQVGGTVTVGSKTLGVTFNGRYAFAQTDGGRNYWDPPGSYISTDVSNAPPASDIIALGESGPRGTRETVTISFSEEVVDPLLALVSWNDNYVLFTQPIEFLSFGPCPFGNGKPWQFSATEFIGLGEFGGVIRVPGTFSSISFTHDNTPDWWHGLTVGVSGLSNVPEPSTLLLLGTGLLGLASYSRRRRPA